MKLTGIERELKRNKNKKKKISFNLLKSLLIKEFFKKGGSYA